MTPLVPMDHHEKMRIRAAAFRATRLYPGPVGELLSRELLTWEEFGMRLAGSGQIMPTVDYILKAALPSSTNESWRAISGWETFYEVSDRGNVISLRSGELLTPQTGSKGHQYVRLSTPKADKLVHRLVLEAFVGPCPNGHECCHGDGDPSNNSLSNLRWDTSSANHYDMVRHGTHYQTAKTHCPGGHELVEPNLVKSKLPNRECLACSLAQKRVHNAKVRHNKVLNQELVADTLYQQICDGKYVPRGRVKFESAVGY